MHLIRRPPFFGYVTAMAAATLLLAGCKGSASPTEPVPSGNIAGAWTGTFDQGEALECDQKPVPALASFQQNGSAVVGTLTVQGDCGFSGVTFQGSLKGNTLAGTVAGGGFYSGSTASGILSGASLEIELRNSFGTIPGGGMHLHR